MRAASHPPELCRARERGAWVELVAAGERLERADGPPGPGDYRQAPLAWRAARYALDVAMGPHLRGTAPVGPVPPGTPPAPGRRERPWWRPAAHPGVVGWA